MSSSAPEAPAVPVLEFVDPPKQAYVNWLLYGPPKVGKTTGAASAPGPILYINADTPNATRFARGLYGDRIKELPFKGFQTMVDVMRVAEAHPEKWGTIVLDSVGDAYRLLLEDLGKRALRVSLPIHGDAQTHMERWCRAMCKDIQTNFVLVCHEMDMADEANGTVERIPFTGQQKPTLSNKLMSMVDVIAYCGVKAEEGKDNEFIAQVINANGRRGGDRFNALEKVETVNLTDWAERATAATAAKEAA